MMTRSNNASLSRLHSQWRDLFRQLCEYKVQFGDCLVPARYSTNPKLGTWVSNQRQYYKLHQEGKSSSMTEERIQTLNAVGFDWRSTYSSWNEQFQELEDYKERFGNCLVSTKDSTIPKLGKWVSTQHQKYKLHQEGKSSQMTEERIRALENPRI